jgi:hypothetical protein
MSDETQEMHEAIPKHIQDFIFLRELSEVYLLIDYISGRCDKTLADTLLIKNVCEIGWPPVGSDAQQATQAADLLHAKDTLNNVAGPASGLTIAFTLLVAGEDNCVRDKSESRMYALWRRAFGRSRHTGEPPNEVSGKLSSATGADGRGRPPTRLSLARLAYPGLVSSAQLFKSVNMFIILFLLLWLVVTCALSWDIAAGHAIFIRVDALRTQSSLFEEKIKVIEAETVKQTSGPPREGARASDIGVLLMTNCNWHRIASAAATTEENSEILNNPDAFRLCYQLSRASLEYAVSGKDLAGWLAPWRHWLAAWNYWRSRFANALCLNCLTIGDRTISTVPEERTDEQWGAILLEVLASAVLPLCYGVLGAGAAVVRSLWEKMRESLLSPRDLTLALQQLALGAVIGACIGLFVSPSGTASPAGSGLLGSVVLSASALSFVAGFGVENVFVALEGFMKRVFNIPQSSPNIPQPPKAP